MTTAARVWREDSGLLRVAIDRNLEVDEIRAAAVALVELLRDDDERLILEIPPRQIWRREFGTTWSQSLAAHRKRFAATAIVGAHNTAARMAISTIAMLDRQTVRFFETVDEAREFLGTFERRTRAA